MMIDMHATVLICSDMYDGFDPFSVCLYMKKPSTRQYDIQCDLYKTLLTGDHKYEILMYTLF